MGKYAAQEKHLKEHYKPFMFRLRPEEMQAFKDKAAREGTTPTTLIKSFISDYMSTERSAANAFDNEAGGDAWQSSERLFTRWDGAPMRPDVLTKWFRKFVIKNELPDISPHSLRHTFAALQIAGGVPVTAVSHRLGHSTPAVTTSIYAHAIKSATEAAADILQDMLAPGGRF
jgi:integrase